MRPGKPFNLKSFPVIIGSITTWSANCGKTYKFLIENGTSIDEQYFLKD